MFIFFLLAFMLWIPVVVIAWVLRWISSMANDAEEILTKLVDSFSEETKKALQEKEAK